MKHNPFLDLPSRSTATRLGTSATERSTMSRYRDGRKNGCSKLSEDGGVEEIYFPCDRAAI